MVLLSSGHAFYGHAVRTVPHIYSRTGHRILVSDRRNVCDAYDLQNCSRWRNERETSL